MLADESALDSRLQDGSRLVAPQTSPLLPDPEQLLFGVVPGLLRPGCKLALEGLKFLESGQQGLLVPTWAALIHGFKDQPASFGGQLFGRVDISRLERLKLPAAQFQGLGEHEQGLCHG